MSSETMSGLKTVLILSLLCFVTAGAFCDWTGKCVGVTDGDTISVLKDGKAVKIRLDGVDCPESHQDFGQKAKEFTSKLVFGKEVTVNEKDTDRYGRTVGRVAVDGNDLSLELVKAGYAWHYKKYSKDQNLADAEQVARGHKEGLWSAPDPIPPWEFRRGKKTGTETADPGSK